MQPGRLVEKGGEIDPLEAADRAELSETLRAAITDLPDRYRRILEPYFEESLEPREIAARYGMAPGTVRVQIHRAVEILRRGLPTGVSLGAAVGLGRSIWHRAILFCT